MALEFGVSAAELAAVKTTPVRPVFSRREATLQSQDPFYIVGNGFNPRAMQSLA